MNKTIIATGIPILTNVPMKIVINVGGKQKAALETLKTVMEKRGSN